MQQSLFLAQLCSPPRGDTEGRRLLASWLCARLQETGSSPLVEVQPQRWWLLSWGLLGSGRQWGFLQECALSLLPGAGPAASCCSVPVSAPCTGSQSSPQTLCACLCPADASWKQRHCPGASLSVHILFLHSRGTVSTP